MHAGLMHNVLLRMGPPEACMQGSCTACLFTWGLRHACGAHAQHAGVHGAEGMHVVFMHNVLVRTGLRHACGVYAQHASVHGAEGMHAGLMHNVLVRMGLKACMRG